MIDQQKPKDQQTQANGDKAKPPDNPQLIKPPAVVTGENPDDGAQKREDEKPTVLHRLKEWWRDPYRERTSWTDRAIVLLTAGIVLLAWMQWREMNDSGKQTDRIIAADERMATAMEQSNIKAQNAFDSATKQAEITQRPWIGIASVDPFSLSPSDSFGLRFNVVNTGRTPGLNVRTVIVLRSLPVKERFSPIMGAVPAGTIQSASAILPNGTLFIETPRYPLAQAQIDAIKGGTIILYVYGQIAYFDVFGADHITKFCKMIVDTNKSEDCGTDNSAN